ncbi:MAG: TIGR04348 family glycosyltransferase, partial [Bradymonadaceae bacterium]
MDIAIVTPEPTSDTAGNETTSARWRRILEELGHRVRVAYDFEPERSTPDALVALHAHKSHDSIERFEQHHPNRPLIVALTGTDLYEYRHRADRVDQNVGRADALVALQPRAADELPTSARDRLHVAYQSVGLLADTEQFRRSPSFPDADERFDVLVAAHLRDVKDPLRTARAAARLPDDSDLRVRHVGSARSEDWADRAREAENRQPRFQWLGEIPRPEALERIGAADLLTVTSVLE